MHCYLRDTGELPEGAVLVFKASRYFLAVDWFLPVLDLIPSEAIRIMAKRTLRQNQKQRRLIALTPL